MPEASGNGEPVARVLSWRANGDGFDVALVAHRLLRHGPKAWWVPTPEAGLEAGDYLVALTAAQAAAVEAFGVSLGEARAVPAGARPLTPVRAALFSGQASRYPYDAYYALALLRLGFEFFPVDGQSIAAGALDAANLFVIPGGFATWGIDAAEDAPGADAACRRFLDRGGAAIGSCGGAYYLSAGRPGWTGTADAKPLYTHEYLQSGVGVVDLKLAPGPLRAGCPPTMEVPYYHGPIYGEVGEHLDVLATFANLVLPGGVAIDNPLDHDRFARDMAGRPAILHADGPRGRAILFSPHPEMGDLLRKYIALDGYARRYLPIRGFETLRDTMRHYRIMDAPSFRLLSNAVDWLSEEVPALPEAAAERTSLSATALGRALELRLSRLPIEDDPGMAPLLRFLVAELRERLDRGVRQVEAVASACGRGAARFAGAWTHLRDAALARAEAAAPMPVAQELMEVELAAALMQGFVRAAECDRLLGEAG